MPALAVVEQAARTAPGVQGSTWGRYIEAEDFCSEFAEFSQPVNDPSATGGRARLAPAATEGLVYEASTQVRDVADPTAMLGTLAITRSHVAVRAKVSDNGTTEPVIQSSCYAIRSTVTNETLLDSVVASPDDFSAADQWQEVVLDCDFWPDDTDQIVRVKITTAMATAALSIDSVRVLPAADAPP
jgi:hypothetical protein